MSSPTRPPATKKLRKCSPRPFQLPPFPESSSPAGSVSSASPARSSGPSAHAGSLSSASPARYPALSLASPSRSPALSSVSPARSPALSSSPSSTPALLGTAGAQRRIPFLAPLPVPIAGYPSPERPLMVDVQCLICKTERAIFAAMPCGHRLYCIGCFGKMEILGKTIRCSRCGLAIEGWKQAAWENAAAADPQGAQQR